MRSIAIRLLLGLVLAGLALAALVTWLNLRGEAAAVADPGPFRATPQQVERGAYLARAGNCSTCHTDRGGAEYAGGRGILTPFGTVYAGNLTPDPQTGLGLWTAADFWRALHHGRSRDGRLLYPAFPYPSFTQVNREDSDALYAYLRSLAPVVQARREHALRFPFQLQASLAVWRALFFRAGGYQPDTARTAEWNRGAYLVQGLGHCAACHAARNVMGATSDSLELSGGLIPMQKWYAPSLAARQEAGVADWQPQQVVELLKAGASARGSVMGPMAEVVYRSTQYLSDADLQAMAVYLISLPQREPEAGPRQKADAATLRLGQKTFDKHCADCHGEHGEGARNAYPPLAGNRAVTMALGANPVHIVVSGGFLPATAANSRPYGMPPFGQTLNDTEIAAVVSYIRQAWGNTAGAVLPLEVERAR